MAKKRRSFDEISADAKQSAFPSNPTPAEDFNQSARPKTPGLARPTATPVPGSAADRAFTGHSTAQDFIGSKRPGNPKPKNTPARKAAKAQASFVSSPTPSTKGAAPPARPTATPNPASANFNSGILPRPTATAPTVPAKPPTRGGKFGVIGSLAAHTISGVSAKVNEQKAKKEKKK